ncbi:calcium-translocating P-type ATPase, SERCA-type [Microaerobacter geothermalis]|uniref:calcium-translocating P-type ATPase, SERCA-type n=1 Tax=Microaerobacter geothermalis TaxID=674972 RepID=UPI001F3AE153|nr:calcium-translocating P-type ATPase, SERCA-type [Microaerobacter geothermalis]MCF6094876.1 calcium-translocating P-type ATPase, SERCA-type [Microaerobacter geothermalis]
MNNRKWYREEVARLEQVLHTDLNHGLTWKEAKRRLNYFGPNSLKEGKKINPFFQFLNQFKDFMVLVLLVATLISGLLGEYTDAITIIAIVIINAVLGFVQEFRAEKSLKALKDLTAPNAHVIRDGKLQEISANEVVPGDLVYVEGGDRIPADIRIISSKGLLVDESSLTGESVPVEKTNQMIFNDQISLGDQLNMLFMGTMATRGSCQGIVVATGMDTEMGRIAHLIESSEEIQTPLQQRLEHLGKVLVLLAILLTIAVVVTGISHGQNAYQMFLTGVSLAVAAIPEGLPAIVTIVLALGVQRMIKRRAIVRKLPSVETLGCATAICSDKTGTLTQNKMTVTKIWLDGNERFLTGSGYEPKGEFVQNGKKIDIKNDLFTSRFLELSVMCNHAHLIKKKEKGSFINRKTEWEVVGDPTEGALLVAAAKGGVWREQILSKWEFIEEIPFDSERKRMSVILKNHRNEMMVAVKGAPDVILEHCTHIVWHGKVVPLTPPIKFHVSNKITQFAEQALRTLAIAYKEIPRSSGTGRTMQNIEENLVFVGFHGMIDPPRKEVSQAILDCKRAGIKTIMITGDHQKTAEAIAKQLGMFPPNGRTISGVELDQLSDKEFLQAAEDIYVYARVSPEHKLRIVKALQSKGHVVAMTGDGVNDAPAIKASDIGVSMGITGTDVAKEASALVLSDDNFATIKAAIEEGRSIYDNIRKFIRYLLASNVGEILVMLMAMVAGLPLPLVPIQILWVNLVTDGLPAMALGVDQPEKDTMNRPPRNRKESIFSRGLGWKILSRGFLIGLSTLAAFVLTLQSDPENLVKAQTMAFTTLVMAQLIHVFDCRSERSVFHRNPLQNKMLILAVISSIVLLLGVLYVEGLQPIFRTVPLNLTDWGFVLFFAAIPTFFAGLPHLFKK